MTEEPAAHRAPRLKRRLLVVAGILISWFVVHIALTAWDGLRDDEIRADAAVVFGNTVQIDGRPSPRLKARLDAALYSRERGLADVIIVSGGIGREGFDEAVVMRDYLVAAGVPEDKVITDSNGYTTRQTAKNVVELMERHGFLSVIAVTQFHHVPRAKLALRRAGIRHVTGAHARYFELRDAYALAREFAAYYRYLLMSR